MKWSLLFLLCCLGAGLAACASVDQKSAPAKNDANYHFLMGSSYLEEGNPTRALEEFLMAEKLDGQRIEIHSGLARVYMRKHAYELAEKHYLKALELSGGDPNYENNLGALYLSMERYEDAAVHFRAAAGNLLFSTPEVAWTGLGVAHTRLNDYVAAELDYKKAIELNPTYVQPHFHLGQLYFAQDRPVEAANEFSRAVKIVPDFVDGYYHLGLAQMKARNTELARNAFKEVIRLAPDSTQAGLAANYLNILQ
jgi:Tfp pilus assembly protein PilF